MFRTSNLTEGETIVLETHPHWSFFATPLVVLVATTIVVGTTLASTATGELGSTVVGLLPFMAAVAAWFGVRYVRWVTTILVLTSHRIIVRRGVFARSGIEIPLEWINNVNFKQSALERIIGSGGLVIESGGEDGHSEFAHIRDPLAVQNLIHAQADAVARRRAGYIRTNAGLESSATPTAATRSAHPSAPADVVDQLERLEGLLRRGRLTEEEFHNAKARLLG